jgi:hypothetical protein
MARGSALTADGGRPDRDPFAPVVDRLCAGIASPHLAARARSSVEKWRLFLAARAHTLATATADDVRDFVEAWPWGSESRRHAVYALRSLYELLAADGIVDPPNPWIAIVPDRGRRPCGR